jgi:hypothetical protein
VETLARGVLRVRSCVLDGRLEVLDGSRDEDEIGTAGGQQLGDFPAQSLGSSGQENGLDSG